MDRRLRLFVLAAVAAGAVLLLWRVRSLLVPFVLAAILAYLLNPLVRILEKREVPRASAILVVYAAFAVAATLAVVIVGPLLTAELNAILQTLPRQTERLEAFTFDMLGDLRRLPFPDLVEEAIQAAASRVEQALGMAADRLLDWLPGVFTAVLYAVLAPVLAYFLLRDWPLLQVRLLQWFPLEWQEDILTLVRRVNQVLSGFLRGQLLISLIIGFTLAAAFALLNVRYALLVGLIAGAFDIIPYFGPLIGSIPAMVLALMQSPATAVWAALVLFGVNQLEGILLSPKVVGEYVGLHPVTVIFAVLAGAELFGVLGMLLGVPVAAVIKVVGQFAVDRWSTVPAE